MHFTKIFLIHFLLFITFNLFLYIFISSFHTLLPFQSKSYLELAHHFIPDPQARNRPFNLLSGLAQYDSQWYLKIASTGYQYSPSDPQKISDKRMQNLTFAFFPLYPFLINFFNIVFKNIELSAFILANLLLLANFSSLYFVISKIYSPILAAKTSWLFFLFPFSIFFRSYYAESLLLLLLIWFIYFLHQKNWLISAVFLSMINITKGNAYLINLIFIFFIIQPIIIQKKLHPKQILYLLIPTIGLFFWILFNYLSTDNPLFFMQIISAWYPVHLKYPPLINNLIVLFLIRKLPFHTVHFSQIDAISVIITAALLYFSKKTLKPVFWLISLSIFLSPLLVRDLASYLRYQSISFPIFIYLSLKLPTPTYYLILFIFALGLFTCSLYFVNWYWLG